MRQTAGQLYRFAFEVKKDDFVVTYNPFTRLYSVGKVLKSYQFNIDPNYEHHHIIKVEWLHEKSRDELSIASRNQLGSIMTLFEIVGVAFDELALLKITEKEVVSSESDLEEEEAQEELKDTIITQAHEFIKDKISKLDWEEMQELVAGVLRAMGYKTRISPKGPDRGRDIIASPDGLGFEEPRIIVEVKHRSGSMGAPEVRSFAGGLRLGDKGLYVSIGGFSREAKYEAERSNIPISLVDIDDLVRLITQYYDQFDSDSRALVPLKKIYWPV